MPPDHENPGRGNESTMHNPDPYDYLCLRYYKAASCGNHAAAAQYEKQLLAAAAGDDPRDVLDCAFSHGYSQSH